MGHMARKVKLVGGREITIKTTKVAKGAPRSKRPGANNGPARQRYWANKVLEKHKIKNLMRCNGMTRAEAYLYWKDARRGRMK